MAKVENFRRIQKESVEEQYRPIIDSLSTVLNPFAEQTINAINGNLTITDNLNRELKKVDVEVLTGGTPKTITEFQLLRLFNIQISGINIIKVENLTNTNTYPTSAPFISYTQNGRVITIKNITGLQVNNKFRITLEVIGN